MPCRHRVPRKQKGRNPWVPALFASASGGLELYERRFVQSRRCGNVDFVWLRCSAESRCSCVFSDSVTSVPHPAPWHMSVNRTGVRGVDALYWMRVRVTPKWFEVTPKWFRVGAPDCESLVFRRFVWVRVDGWSCLAPSYSEMVRSYSEATANHGPGRTMVL